MKTLFGIILLLVALIGIGGYNYSVLQDKYERDIDALNFYARDMKIFYEKQLGLVKVANNECGIDFIGPVIK